MRHFLLSLVTAVTLAAAPAMAQACSDLTVSGSGAPGGTLTFAVTGAPAMSPSLLLLGETAGTTAIPFGSLTLGLASPFFMVPLGMTDATGAVAQSLTIPAAASIPLTTLYSQALTVSFSLPTNPTGGFNFAPTFCTSDVESFQIGA